VQTQADSALQIIRVRAGPCEGVVVGSAREAIVAFAERLDWQALRQQAALPGFTTIKSSTVRAVLRGVLQPGHLAVHVKAFWPSHLGDRARDWLRGARAGREFERLRAVAALRLPCVRPLAAVTVRGSGGACSLLVTATAPGDSLPRGPLPPAVAGAAGRLLRALHDAGVRLDDLHPGNLIADAGELRLVDLTSARLGDPLRPAERAHGLAVFCQDLDGGVLDPAAKPLLLAYGAADEVVETGFRLGLRLRARALAAFGRRAFRACRHTAVARQGGALWYWHRPAAELHRQATALVERIGGLPATKQGRRGGVWLHGDLALKLRTAAAARRLFRAAYWLGFARVPAAQPVALRLAGGRGQAIFTRLPWPTLAAELQTGLPLPELRAAARQLGVAVGRLHAHGLRNRDLKLDNLIRDPASGFVHAVDLDGVRRASTTDTRGRAQDLGRLLRAFRDAGSPGGGAVLRSFARGYTLSLRCLRRAGIKKHLWRRTAESACARASAPPSTRAGSRASSAAGATRGAGC
jgi:tRNA A-37 threonylcarbamoyl transferase component Bud32